MKLRWISCNSLQFWFINTALHPALMLDAFLVVVHILNALLWKIDYISLYNVLHWIILGLGGWTKLSIKTYYITIHYIALGAVVNYIHTLICNALHHNVLNITTLPWELGRGVNKVLQYVTVGRWSCGMNKYWITSLHYNQGMRRVNKILHYITLGGGGELHYITLEGIDEHWASRMTLGKCM